MLSARLRGSPDCRPRRALSAAACCVVSQSLFLFCATLVQSGLQPPRRWERSQPCSPQASHGAAAHCCSPKAKQGCLLQILHCAASDPSPCTSRRPRWQPSSLLIGGRQQETTTRQLGCFWESPLPAWTGQAAVTRTPIASPALHARTPPDCYSTEERHCRAEHLPLHPCSAAAGPEQPLQRVLCLALHSGSRSQPFPGLPGKRLREYHIMACLSKAGEGAIARLGFPEWQDWSLDQCPQQPRGFRSLGRQPYACSSEHTCVHACRELHPLLDKASQSSPHRPEISAEAGSTAEAEAGQVPSRVWCPAPSPLLGATSIPYCLSVPRLTQAQSKRGPAWHSNPQQCLAWGRDASCQG